MVEVKKNKKKTTKTRSGKQNTTHEDTFTKIKQGDNQTKNPKP